MDLLSIFGRIVLDKDDYDRGLDEARRAAQSFGGDFESATDRVASGAGEMGSAVGEAGDALAGVESSAGAAASAMGEAGDKALDYGEAVSDASRSMDDAGGQADSMGTAIDGVAAVMGGAMGAAAAFGSAVVDGFTTAVDAAMNLGGILADLAGQFIDSAGEAAAYGDNIDKASQKMGISAEAYQEWDAVLQHSGTSIDSLKKGMMTLSTSMDELANSSEKKIDTEEIEKARLAYVSSERAVKKAEITYSEAVKKHGKNSAEAVKASLSLKDAQDKATAAQGSYKKAMEGTAPEISKASLAIKGLGVQVTDANGNMRDQEEVFSDVITALQNIDDESRRTAVAQEIFGRSAMELGPLLNTSAEDTQAMKDRVHELGGVMSDDAVKASAAYQDSLQDMNTAIDGASRNIVSEFLPSMSMIMDGIADIISGGDGVDGLSMGIEAFADTLADVIPRVIDIGGDLLEQFTIAILDNLPLIIETGTQAIVSFVTGVLEHADQIAEAAINILTTLATSLGEALPVLLPAAVEAIITIVDKLTEPETLAGLVDAAIAIITGLANGLIAALPKLIEAAPKIVANLVVTFIENAPKLLGAAAQLLGSVVKGLLDNAGSAVEAIGTIVDMIGTGISVMINDALSWGKEVLDNFGSGFTGQIDTVMQTVTGFVGKVWDGFKGIVTGAFDWGKDMIDNFKKGIENMWNSAVDKVKGFAGKIKSLLGFSEPEEGPLSDFHTYAPDMMALFAKGIEDNAGLVTDAIGDAFDVQPRIEAAYGMPGPFDDGEAYGAGTDDGQRGRPIQIVFEFDGIKRWIYNATKAEEQRVGVVLTGV